jgi:sigma-B regulation protein RsbU (phosphoserine phosphatase)
MIDNIKSFLQSLNEFPEDKLPPEFNTPTRLRAYTFGNYCFLLAAFVYALFIIIFIILSVYILAIINIFSVIIWIVALFLMWKGYAWKSYAIGAVEIIAHTVLCVVIIGWDAGFQYYVFIQPILIFFTPWRLFVKILIATAFTIAYIVLEQYASISNPYIYLNPFYLAILNCMNLVTALIISAFGTYTYYNTTIKLEKELEKEHQKTNKLLAHFNSELTEAAEYVKTILPQPLSNDFVQIDWRFIPSTSLGGDAFGYHMIDDDHLAIYIIDVSGHGVGAALLSVSVINVLRSHSLPKTDFKKPDQVLNALNISFPSEANKDMFFTIWYGVYNKNDRNLVYASSGHPPAILIGSDMITQDNLELLKTPNYVIGGLADSVYSKHEYTIKENDRLYIFSDGVYEIEKKDGMMWRFKEFQEYISRVSSDSKSVLDKVYSHAKNINVKDVFSDDFTILEVEFK